MKFGYTHRREMEPVPGRKYSTVYYRQSASERRRTQAHVERVIQRVGEKALENPGAEEALLQPMPRFQRRETRGAYSPVDIMSDMLGQMQSGKDIPSGMLGRWNRLFDGTGLEIDMVLESELPAATQFDDLFAA
jgi:hypothetical protein